MWVQDVTKHFFYPCMHECIGLTSRTRVHSQQILRNAAQTGDIDGIKEVITGDLPFDINGTGEVRH